MPPTRLPLSAYTNQRESRRANDVTRSNRHARLRRIISGDTLSWLAGGAIVSFKPERGDFSFVPSCRLCIPAEETADAVKALLVPSVASQHHPRKRVPPQ
ncbi:hypothetical protein MTO96_003340 [Rhipicephalus appendiculatus]